MTLELRLTNIFILVKIVFPLPQAGMQSYTTPTWGYKQISSTQINFYHILLPRVSVQTLARHIPFIQGIESRQDKSIVIAFSDSSKVVSIIQELNDFFDKKAFLFLDTPSYYYKIALQKRQSLLEWAFAFEGCLALLLIHDKKIKQLVKPSWQFINSPIGGLWLEPYTLFLYANYPKIIHPVTLQNYENRKTVEQKTSYYIRRMIGRIEDAQPGLEGLALLSLVETKTNLSAKEIQKIVNDASFGIKTPKYSPFFNETL